MFSKLCDNLNLLMAEARIKATELARETGLPASSIKKIRNCDNPNPTLTTLLPLANYFSLTLSQLVGDEPLPDKQIQGSYKQSIEKSLRHIPLLAWDEAIAWPASKNQTHSLIATERDYSENAYALNVEENDWENLATGTILLIDPLLQTEHKDFIIVYKEGNKIPTLKQVLYDDGQLYLKPVVKGYNISVFTAEHKLLGVVVEYKKLLKSNDNFHHKSNQ